jgi:hypothetical protein
LPPGFAADIEGLVLPPTEKHKGEDNSATACVNSHGSIKWAPIVFGKSSKLCFFKNVRMLFVKYRTSKKVWVTTTIFT